MKKYKTSQISFPDFVIQEIESAFYKGNEQVEKQLIKEHRKLMQTPEENSMVVKYKTITRVSLGTNSYDRMVLQKLHPDLEERANRIIHNLKQFEYDMDKLKNFLSYMVRFCLGKEVIDVYIPIYFTKDFRFPDLKFTQLNPPTNIKEKFSEEIELLKRYYLMVRLKDLE